MSGQIPAALQEERVVDEVVRRPDGGKGGRESSIPPYRGDWYESRRYGVGSSG
ncbi:hypothetical protein ACFW6E_43675 [Streptomyces olivaceoviridis]|uniref:hypothetical protein n=1 Tax=Streptomyces olivaceoviridis TaxID=1921 RepID=UPI00368049A1